MYEGNSTRPSRFPGRASRAKQNGTGPSPRVLFVSTYPPTRCGIATFTDSLVSQMAKLRGGYQGLGIARLVGDNDDIRPTPHVEVVAAVDSPLWPEAVARAAGEYDILWIQHEFGIFGSNGSETIPALLRLVNRPIVTTFHTVLTEPSNEQAMIMEELLAESAVSVALSHSARNRLLEVHDVEPDRVRVIPHGAGQHRITGAPDPLHPRILTWGLLGPGKGIEWGIEAMARLSNLEPRPHYLVAGATHPNVLRTQGPIYRDGLETLASDLGVGDMVSLEDTYLTPQRLEELLGGSHVVLLPYDSTEQVTSGVLVEALAAGKPVIATGFPHAVELLSGGAGTVVPHRDPDAIAAALERYLTDPTALRAAEKAAAWIRPRLLWSSVARQSEAVAREAAGRAPGHRRLVLPQAQYAATTGATAS